MNIGQKWWNTPMIFSKMPLNFIFGLLNTGRKEFPCVNLKAVFRNETTAFCFLPYKFVIKY